MSARSASVCLLVAVAVLAASGCGTPGRNVPVDVGQAPEPHPDRLVALEAGHLLSADPEESLAAERRLTTLDEIGRRALQRHADAIPNERDPRWLNVLEENQMLPPLPPAADLEYLLWKVTRDESFYVTKAQGRLLVLAGTHPDLLLDRLARGGRGTESLAVALAMARETRAVPPLLARYRGARSPAERRVATEALALLAGEAHRPRLTGTEAQIERDAAEIQRWYSTLPKEEASP